MNVADLRLKNSSKGEIFYGMHFYPGLARYDSPGEDGFTVFLNEDTIRNMGTTFPGCPVFVEHVDEVDDDVNELRKEADGWVIESFFNQADGKHWVKFVVVSDRGLQAIRRGFRLSNAFICSSYKPGGLWNGIPYQKEVAAAEFEHLAIVANPRYEESVIMTPDEFKTYNESKDKDLKRFANSRGEEKNMGFKFLKRKIENSDVNLDGVIVELPKSKKEVLVTKAVEEYDKFLNMNGYANGDHMVKVGNDEMSVNDLVKKHLETCNAMDEMKKNAATEDGGEPGADDEDDPALENDSEKQMIETESDNVGARGGDFSLKNEEDEDEDKDEKEKKKNKKQNSGKYTLEEAAKLLAKQKADKLKNANLRNSDDGNAPVVSLPRDQVLRGKQLYGSGN